MERAALPVSNGEFSLKQEQQRLKDLILFIYKHDKHEFDHSFLLEYDFNVFLFSLTLSESFLSCFY